MQTCAHNATPNTSACTDSTSWPIGNVANYQVELKSPLKANHGLAGDRRAPPAEHRIYHSSSKLPLQLCSNISADLSISSPGQFEPSRS